MTKALDVFRYVLDLGGVLSTVGQSAAFALIRVVDSETWCWPKHVDDEHGYSVGTIAQWIGKSKRHARRGLAELERLGIGKREVRPWSTSRYLLFPERLRELAVIAKTQPAPATPAPVLEREPCPGAGALQSAAEALGPDLPKWATSNSKHARPADLARLAWCWASALYPASPAEHAGLFARRLERLRRQLDISAELLAERLIMVAAWLREVGRISSGPGADGQSRRYGPHDVLRPRNWAQVVEVAREWWQDRQRRAAELPPELSEDVDDEDVDDTSSKPVELDNDEPRVAELLAELAQLVPEVERMAADLAGLPELPDLTARPSIDPERRRVHGQRLLRAELAEALDHWRTHTSAALSAPLEARPAALHELAAAMARLRELSGLLAR